MYSLPKGWPKRAFSFRTDSGDRSLPAARQSRWCLSASKKIAGPEEYRNVDRGNIDRRAIPIAAKRAFSPGDFFLTFLAHTFEVWRGIQKIKSTFIRSFGSDRHLDFDSAGNFLANTPAAFAEFPHDFDAAQYLCRHLCAG